MAFIDYAGETEEERRKRLAEEAAAAAMSDEATASGGGAPSAFDSYFSNRLGAAGDRIAQASQYLTDPAAALERRLAQQSEAANTEVQSQTTKTYGDGSQEQIVKTQRPAPQAEVTGPAVPQAMPPQQAMPVPQAPQQTAPAVPAGQEPRPQVFPAFAQAVQQNQARPMPPISAEAATQPVNMPPMPQPGPGVQVASADAAAGLQAAAAARAQQQAQQTAAQAPAVTPSLQQIAQTMPAAVEAPWIKAANDAGNDFLKLAEVAGRYPESRQAIVEKLQSSFKNKSLEDQANKLLSAAQSGDLKAWNQIQQAIKPETGRAKEEVTMNDYVKAYMFKRLGLDALAQDVQNKIIGKETKFGQLTVGNTNWATETDVNGNIIRAKDDEGNVATESTLNKLRAAGQKFGGQIYSQTGDIHNTQDGKQVVKVFNSTTGKPQWTDIDTGEQWKGKGNPQPQSIATQMAKMDYGVISDYRKKFGTDKLAAVDQARKDGIIKSPSDEAAFLDRWNFAGGVPGFGAPGAAVTPAAGTAPPPLTMPGQTPPPAAGTAAGTAAPAAAGQRPGQRPGQATPGGGGGGGTAPPVRGQNEPETVYQNRVKAWEVQNSASVQQAKELAVAEQKPPAEARGKLQAKDVNNQGYADSTYGLIKPISDSIRQSTGSSIGAGADKLAGVVGVGTKGAENIARLEVLGYQLLSNVPRFEGPQSDIDVQMYKQAAGDLANSSKPVNVRLAALDSIVMMLKKYDKAGNNDWSFGQPGGGGNIRIISREKVK